MKLTQWLRSLETQRTRYGKVQYTATELAHLAGCTLPVLNVALSRLLKEGVLMRYARGVYGLPGAENAEALLPRLDAQAYITAGYALSSLSFITQPIRRISCFTRRRHNLSRTRETALGVFEFVTVSPAIYSPPQQGVTAGPEQAFLDFLYITLRRGLTPRSLVMFRNLHTLDKANLERLMPRYPATVRREAAVVIG